MNEKKRLTINAMICDFRNVSEEVLRQYEKVYVKSMLAYVTEKSLVLLNRYGVQMDAMTVEKLDEDVKIVENNGACRIGAGAAAQGRIYLIANGKLTIEEDAREVLENYVRIMVNGKVIYPDSLSDIIAPMLTCNGTAVSYPADAVLVEKNLTADRVFASRAAADGKYYVTGTVYFTDPDMDYGNLVSKNVHIQAGKAIVAENVLEKAVKILDGKAEIIMVPQGCVCVRDVGKLDKNFVLQYGSRVLVDGDLTVEDASALEKMEFLQVTGRTLLNEKDKPAFLKVCKKHRELETYYGRLVYDVAQLTIDRGMLEAAGEGLTVVDCAEVEVRDDVDSSLVKDRLYLTDCASVRCPKKLMGIIKLQATDIAQFVESEKDDREPDGKESEEGIEVVHIDTMKYVM